MARPERAGLAAMRGQLLGGVSGQTLELGAGTGLNLGHYPREGVELTLTEPTEAMAARLERKALHVQPDARVVRTVAERLPFDTGSFDLVVATLVLCTVRDVSQTLAEVKR